MRTALHGFNQFGNRQAKRVCPKLTKEGSPPADWIARFVGSL